MQKTIRSLRQSQERIHAYTKISPQARAISFASGVEDYGRIQLRDIEKEQLKQKIIELENYQQENINQSNQLNLKLNEQQIINHELCQQLEHSQFKLEIEKKDSYIYQQQVEKLEEQFNYQQDCLNTLRQQIQVLEQALENQDNKNQLQLSLLNQTICNQDNEIKYLKTTIQTKQEELNDLKQQQQQQIQTKYKLNVDQDSIQILENKLESTQKQFQNYKNEKEQEIIQLQKQIDQFHHKVTTLESENNAQDDISQQLVSVKIELEGQIQINKQLNQQIVILQQQINQTNIITQTLKEEKVQIIKEKQAIESYYLDQLQKQDLQLSQMIKQSVQNEQRTQIQKLQIVIEQKDLMIRELSIQKDCVCSKQQKIDQKGIIRDLEKKNATLVMEVERLNKILKQKLTELENQNSRISDDNNKKLIEEIDNWKNKFLQINKQYHIIQEQLMVVKTELDGLKKNKQKENIIPPLQIKQ